MSLPLINRGRDHASLQYNRIGFTQASNSFMCIGILLLLEYRLLHMQNIALQTFFKTDHLTCRGRGLWFFVSFRNLFSDNTRVRIFFFQNSTLGYMTKTLNQIIFFLHHNQNIFYKWSFP